MINKTFIDEGIFKYSFAFSKLKDALQAQCLINEINKVLYLGTYGGMNTDILYDEYCQIFSDVKRDEICPTDDEDIGLRMPEFWPINLGNDSLSIAMYYCKEQMRYSSGFNNFPNWNTDIRKKYGWNSIVELFNYNNVYQRIIKEKINYFSTPFTLTECMRYLEGWQLERLNVYKSYALKIFDWAKKQPFYVKNEWFLGRDESRNFIKLNNRITNVRYCVKMYWQNYLLNKPIQLGDKELNIVSRKFSDDRRPEIVLIGEDFFPLKGRFDDNDNSISDKIVFTYNFINRLQHSIPLKHKKDSINNEGNAILLKKKYPNANIIILSYEEGNKLFKLIKDDNIKEGISIEIVLSYLSVLDIYGLTDLQIKLIKCIC